jgi:hypothetical protein
MKTYRSVIDEAFARVELRPRLAVHYEHIGALNSRSRSHSLGDVAKGILIW